MTTRPPNTRSPMYFRIQQIILDQMQRGLYKPGQKLPTETELAQQFQVSRITAKRALDELVRKGRAFRQQGRGTFVAQTRIRDISGFGSFSEDILARGLIPGARVLICKEIEPEGELRDQLQTAAGEHVFLLKRVRFANHEPVAVETAYLPCHLCPDLIHEDLASNSLYAILREKYQVIPTWADAEIEATAASKEEAALLGLSPGQPVLTAHRVTFTANFEVIEFTTSVYRGDRFTFYTGRQFMG